MLRHQPLKHYTTFRIGGPAAFLIEPKGLDELRRIIAQAKIKKRGVAVLGSGSNILVSDKGCSKIIVRLCAPFFKRITVEGNTIHAGAGVSLSSLINTARKNRLSGLEFLLGIPGTVGGALVMNAGGASLRESIGRFVVSVTVLEPGGEVRTLRNKEIRFGYRESGLRGHIITSAIFKLRRARKESIEKRLASFRRYRSKTPGLRLPNAGCIFKNPKGHSAAALIEKCGLKEKRIGGAVVSDVHANYIVNVKDARARDVLRLMDVINKAVNERFNIELKPEIKIWQ